AAGLSDWRDREAHERFCYGGTQAPWVPVGTFAMGSTPSAPSSNTAQHSRFSVKALAWPPDATPARSTVSAENHPALGARHHEIQEISWGARPFLISPLPAWHSIATPHRTEIGAIAHEAFGCSRASFGPVEILA